VKSGKPGTTGWSALGVERSVALDLSLDTLAVRDIAFDFLGMVVVVG
jgi:hypothetical protein